MNPLGSWNRGQRDPLLALLQQLRWGCSLHHHRRWHNALLGGHWYCKLKRHAWVYIIWHLDVHHSPLYVDRSNLPRPCPSWAHNGHQLATGGSLRLLLDLPDRCNSWSKWSLVVAIVVHGRPRRNCARYECSLYKRFSRSVTVPKSVPMMMVTMMKVIASTKPSTTTTTHVVQCVTNEKSHCAG